MGIMGFMGFMGFMGGMGGMDRMDGHIKYGQAFGDEGLPIFYTVVFILCFIPVGSPVRPLLLFYRIAREADAEFLEDLTVNL